MTNFATGPVVSTANFVDALPERPATSVAVTLSSWLPSASGAGGTNGEAQGVAEAPSSAQVKLARRLAAKAIEGRVTLLSGRAG